MKWLIIILVVLFAGWKLVTFWVDRQQNETSLNAVDNRQAKAPLVDSTKRDSVKAGSDLDTIEKKQLSLPAGTIDTKGVKPEQVVDFAKTLIGVSTLR